MGFAVSEDHARQEQVWDLLAHSFNKSATYIRQRLTENTVRVADKRVGVDGFGPWSVKAGLHHVAPPFDLLGPHGHAAGSSA